MQFRRARGSEIEVGESRRRYLVISIVAAMMLMIGSPAFLVDAYDCPADLHIGPYIDRVVYKTIGDAYSGLISGEVDLILTFMGEDDAIDLEQHPEINVSRMLRMGYGHITINCEKYPLNISAFRRAFAFAFDKSRIVADVWGGNGQEHDSMVPYPMSWCIEDDLAYHYYSAQPGLGNQLLNDAGFTINPMTGYRLAPDGTPFQIVFEYFAVSIHNEITQIALDAFASLHVDAVSEPAEFGEVLYRMDFHQDYDMVMYASQFARDEVNWLATHYGSEYADKDFQNPTNFRNETFDSWLPKLMQSTDYGEVYEAAAEMQRILHYNVPRIVTYHNMYIQPYRVDTFTGHIQDKGRYISSQWTLRNLRKIDGTRGGTVSIRAEEVNSFNPFNHRTIYAAEVLINLWPSLFSRDPNLQPWPYLAKSCKTETHVDNTAVTAGNTRFTIDIIENATWSDGEPLTAADVANTFTYLLESGRFGNPWSSGLEDLVAAYALTPTRLIVEFNTESYWHFANFAYTLIVPKHIFNPVDGYDYDEWNMWNPIYDPTHPYVTCGPFELTDYVMGEFYELSANPDFPYYPEFEDSTTTPTQSTTPVQGPNLRLAIYAGAISAGTVIFSGTFVMYNMFKKE
jgi:ABC-type transport system substrate-binding protein